MINPFFLLFRDYLSIFYLIHLLLGVYIASTQNLIALLPLFALWIGLLVNKHLSRLALRSALAVCFFIAGLLSVQMPYCRPDLMQNESLYGKAYIKIKSIRSQTNHFGANWVYRVTIKNFQVGGRMEGYNLEASIRIPQAEGIARPKGDRDYVVEGVLKHQEGGFYTLSIAKDEPWMPVAGSWSFSEHRFAAKQWMAAFIQDKMSDKRSATFLAGIFTGEFDDPLMAFEFGRFGLQHIMAISGFHFSLLTVIIGYILGLFFDRKTAAFLMLTLVCLYFLFLGWGASIVRAWLSIVIVLAGNLFYRQGNGINTLGAVVILIILLDPMIIYSLGFRFSVLTTAGILFLYSFGEYLFRNLMLKRVVYKAIQMDLLSQHSYLILTFFRQTLSLALAVNLVAIPMTLFHFHKFPILSLFYNLFFPFMVSISMLLLIMGLLFSAIPFAGQAIFRLNDYYTGWLLGIVYDIPVWMDITIRIEPFPSYILMIYFTLLFGFGLCWKAYLAKRGEEAVDLAYV